MTNCRTAILPQVADFVIKPEKGHMKIIHVCKVWYPRITGVTVHVDSLARKMAWSGHRVCVVTYDLTGNFTGSVDVFREDRTMYTVIRVRPGSRPLLADVIRKEKPDVVHAHGIWEHVWPSFLVARALHAGFFITAHGTWQFLYDTPGFEKKTRQLKYRIYYHTLWRYMVMNATAMIALNVIETRVHKALGAARVFRIPNGVDCHRFRPEAGQISPEDDHLPGAFVLFAGAIQEQKGIFTLMEALGKLKEKGICVPVVVVGDGPHRDKAKRMALQENFPVIFKGRMDRIRMPNIMARARLFVLPSLDEPFATVYLEAMASGTPCVGTRTGGTPEIIDHCINGCLIPPGDSNALARILEQFLSNPETFRQWGHNAREKVLSRFDWSILSEKILRVYESRSM